MKDILLDNDDLCFASGTGDFSYAEDTDAILQQRKHELEKTYGDDISEPSEGSVVAKFLNSEFDQLNSLSFLREIKRIIKKDDHIKSDSVKIVQPVETELSALVSFETVEGVFIKNWNPMEGA
ncbi:MAG: hypothetical protein JW982_06415 [Spirochaetes bacterium]|nr:hypothetical protein [Spirochaetota bacterium]